MIVKTSCYVVVLSVNSTRDLIYLGRRMRRAIDKSTRAQEQPEREREGEQTGEQRLLWGVVEFVLVAPHRSTLTLAAREKARIESEDSSVKPRQCSA